MRGADEQMSSTRGHRARSRDAATGLRRAAVVAVAFGVFAAAASTAQAANVNIVTKRPPTGTAPNGTAYFTTIQAAVNASTSGDYVLIEPGVYDEEVKVASAHSRIWIRGMNRNSVIIDGQHRIGNGIEVHEANDVWIET